MNTSASFDHLVLPTLSFEGRPLRRSSCNASALYLPPSSFGGNSVWSASASRRAPALTICIPENDDGHSDDEDDDCKSTTSGTSTSLLSNDLDSPRSCGASSGSATPTSVLKRRSIAGLSKWSLEADDVEDEIHLPEDLYTNEPMTSSKAATALSVSWGASKSILETPSVAPAGTASGAGLPMPETGSPSAMQLQQQQQQQMMIMNPMARQVYLHQVHLQQVYIQQQLKLLQWQQQQHRLRMMFEQQKQQQQKNKTSAGTGVFLLPTKA